MNRVALVTGGASGIGLGISKALASEGFDLAVCGRRKADAVDAELRTLRDAATEVRYVAADISSAADRSRLVEQVRSDFGRLDLLVNNAGVAPETRANVLEASEQSFDRVLGVNLKGPYFLTQAIARWMIELKRNLPSYQGAIINISSISATVASPNRGEYCVSKAGLAMATQLWAVCLAEFDIPVFEVRPGIVRSDMTDSVSEKYDRLIRSGLLLQPRWGIPEDVGRAVAMLARGDLAYSTGQVIMVDGGLTVGRLL